MINTIYLKFGNYTGTTLTMSTPLTINALSAIKRIMRKVVAEETLRKRKIVNKIWSRLYYDCKFSSSVINTNLSFFESFFQADYWEMSLDGTNYFAVVFDDEEFNLEYLNESIYLPEWKVKLYKVGAE